MARRTSRGLCSARARRRMMLVTAALLAWSVVLCEADVTIAWDPVLSDSVSGYNVYYGTASHAYAQQVFAGNTNLVTIGGLRPNTTYYFAVTVVVGTLESGYSDEIVFEPSITAPSMAVSALNQGRCALKGAAPAGHVYDVLATTNFVGWQAIGVLSIGANQTFSFVDPMAYAYPARFYRLHETTFAGPPSLQLFGNTDARQLLVQGQLGHRYDVLASQDLANWALAGTVTAGAQGTAAFIDPLASCYRARFYLLHDVTFVSPTPSCQLLSVTNGGIQLQIQGLAGHTYNVLITQDFITWTPFGTVTPGLGGQAVFTDPEGARVFRFYSVREATTL